MDQIVFNFNMFFLSLILKVFRLYSAWENWHLSASRQNMAFDLYGTIYGFRTLQTTVGVFGGEGYTDKTDVLPLMVANAGNSYRAAISSLNSPPVVAVELCRVHLVWNSTL